MPFDNKGTVPVYLFYEGTNKIKLLNRKYWLNKDDDTMDKLKTYFGEQNVKIKL